MKWRIFLNPDGGANPTAGTSQPSAPAPTPAPTPSPTPAPQSAQSSGPAGASGGAGSSQPTAAPSSNTPGFNAAASPASAAAAAVTPTPTAQQFAPTQQPAFDPRSMPPHMQQLLHFGYQKWVEQQAQQQPNRQYQQPAQQQQQQQKNPFGIPNVDFFALRGMIGRDEHGNIVGKPGAPLDAAQQFQQYAEAFERAQHGFFSDPEKYIGDIIEKRANEIAQRQFQQNFQQTVQQQETRSIIANNASWLYAHENGQQVFDYNPLTGQNTPRLSTAGQLYAKYAQHAHELGITNPTRAHEYAFSMLQAAFIRAQQQQNSAATVGQQQAQNFVQNAAAATPIAPQPSPSNVPQPQPGRTLRDALRDAFNQNGINDKVLEEQMRLPQGNAA